MNQFERQPSWRWQLIQELRNARKRVPTRFKSDTWLTRGSRFWNAFQKATDSEQKMLAMMKVEAEYPVVSAAHTIYTGLGLERYFIEALVMADVGSQDIGDSSGHTARVISCYEQLFFDVRRHLDKNLFIMGNVLGPMFNTAIGNDYDHLWKAVGYYCGPDALKSLWTLGPIPDESYTKLASILRNRLITQATSASFARQPNSYNAGEIIDSFLSHGTFEINKAKADFENSDKKELDNIPADVLQYAEMKLAPYDAERDAQEHQLGKQGKINKDDYERPPAFRGSE